MHLAQQPVSDCGSSTRLQKKKKKRIKTVWGIKQSFHWYPKFPAKAYRPPEQQLVSLPLCSIVHVSDNFFLNSFCLLPKKGHSSDLQSLLVCVSKYQYLFIHLKISAAVPSFLECEHQGKTVPFSISLHGFWSGFFYLSLPHFFSCQKTLKQTNPKPWILLFAFF